jgi:STELLO glycosyltransferase-like protein
MTAISANPPRYSVVMTSIFPPSEAVRAFARRNDCKLYVAGDRKTPGDWQASNVRFLSASEQEQFPSRLVQLLPWNHYCRKQSAYLLAIAEGAEIIVDTDDDNVPKTFWSVPAFAEKFDMTGTDCGFVNVYRAFTKQFIWPRGFPLARILDKNSIPSVAKKSEVRIGVWQGLADGDPDVDAIYRLTNNNPCNFAERLPLVLDEGTLCPFNSQNTAFCKAAFPLLYLPASVTFRYTDILRGLIAQPILWAAGYRLGFTGATVVQERNPHNFLKDFESEIPCYLHPDRVIDAVRAVVSTNSSIAENLVRAYENLIKAGLVPGGEIKLLEAWLHDLSIAAKTF